MASFFKEFTHFIIRKKLPLENTYRTVPPNTSVTVPEGTVIKSVDGSKNTGENQFREGAVDAKVGTYTTTTYTNLPAGTDYWDENGTKRTVPAYSNVTVPAGTKYTRPDGTAYSNIDGKDKDNYYESAGTQGPHEYGQYQTN